MQLIFEKKLPVKVLTTYLELSKEEIHSDIQDYLKKFAANKLQNSTFDTRVQIYLNQIGLLEKQQNNNIYFLSDKGKIAHEKGLVERQRSRHLQNLDFVRIFKSDSTRTIQNFVF